MQLNLIKKIIILMSFVCAVVILLWLRLPAVKTEIFIEEGTNAKRVAVMLYDSKIIYSKTVFLGLLKLSGNSKNIKAGIYEMSPRDNLISVIRKITKGRAVYQKITIPEGFTSAQIAERLSQKGITNKEEFMKIVLNNKLEGYLFPQTYQFAMKTPAEEVINAMLGLFNKNFTPEMKERLKSLRSLDEKKALTLASIIEKEAKIPDERPLISAVFHNRMKKGMYLESCATVLYALGKHKEQLVYADLNVNSPYNTYRHYGLPPGPICNPGKASIEAALYPAKSDALYFVVSSSGTHTFSKSLSEHVKNKIIMKKTKKIKK